MSYLFIGLLIMWVINLGYMVRVDKEQKKVSKQLDDFKKFIK
jgi:CcmD family protein